MEPLQLNNNTILVGQDGWADGQLGNYDDSQVVLNDSRMIADLFQEKLLGRSQLLAKMQQLTDPEYALVYIYCICAKIALHFHLGVF
ncbi:phosphoesterase [Legionella pneumophila]|nr:Uncharacterised protein [Legionella pneumophila]STX81934.1 phosphoesterase [Legionella pneumophila]